MDTATQILVIITSSVLVIFLIIAIVAAVAVLRIVKTIRRIADRAEHVIENAETAAATFRNAAGPLSLLKTIANIVDSVNKHRKGK
jgi:type II secretory pathway pseudopilin PulG